MISTKLPNPIHETRVLKLVSRTIHCLMFWAQGIVTCIYSFNSTVQSIQDVLKIFVGKDVMQGKLYQKCTHPLYCSVLSLGGNVNTRRMSKPDIGPIFHVKNQWNILVIGNYYVNYQSVMLLTSSDTKQTLMHLFLVSICTQSIRNCKLTFLAL